MTQKKSAGAALVVSVLQVLMSLLLNFIFYAVSVLIIVNLARGAYSFAYQVFGSQVVDSAPGRSITITIGEEDTMRDVAKTLEQQKIIINKTSFEMRAVLTKKEVQPGTYTVNSSQSYAEILNVLASSEKASSS
jgi:UPF0755 protein